MKKALIIILMLGLLTSLFACTGGSDKELSESSVSSEISDESSEVSADASDTESSTADDESGNNTELSESTDTESSEGAGDESSEAEGIDVNLLVGTWKRVATEAEGDLNDGGDCTITITGTSKDDLKVSYYDKAFPDTRFSDKSVTVIDRDSDGELPAGVWYAVIDHVGVFDTHYDFTVLENGQLQLCNSFEIDGAPAASYEIFEKAE